MEETLVQILLATPAIVAITGQKIRLGRADQRDARPYVVLQTVSSAPSYHMQGEANPVPIRMQIDCYADKYGQAKTLARAIKSRLSGYQGGPFKGVFIDSERDLPAADAGEVTSLFRTSIDITVHYGA
jgi:Protein of unknown function (DUF3168).